MRYVNNPSSMEFEDFIFPDRIRTALKGLLDHPKAIPPVLCFHGYPGVGKTTFAKHMVNRLCLSEHHFAMSEKGSVKNFIDKKYSKLLQSSLAPFLVDQEEAEEKSFEHGIILDEFHNLTPKDQDAFKSVFEEQGDYLVILCVNTTPKRKLSTVISPPIKSRVHDIDFNVRKSEIEQVLELTTKKFPELSEEKIRALLPDYRQIERAAHLLRNIPQN